MVVCDVWCGATRRGAGGVRLAVTHLHLTVLLCMVTESVSANCLSMSRSPDSRSSSRCQASLARVSLSLRAGRGGGQHAQAVEARGGWAASQGAGLPLQAGCSS